MISLLNSSYAIKVVAPLFDILHADSDDEQIDMAHTPVGEFSCHISNDN